MESLSPQLPARPTSRPDVALAERAYDAFARRDLDAYLGLLHPCVRFDALTPEAPYRGHQGVRQWWSDLFSAIPDFAAEVQGIRALRGLLLATLCTRGHGARSQAPFEQTVWEVSEWRGGKLLSWQTYGSVADARSAVGRHSRGSRLIASPVRSRVPT